MTLWIGLKVILQGCLHPLPQGYRWTCRGPCQGSWVVHTRCAVQRNSASPTVPTCLTDDSSKQNTSCNATLRNTSCNTKNWFADIEIRQNVSNLISECYRDQKSSRFAAEIPKVCNSTKIEERYCDAENSKNVTKIIQKKQVTLLWYVPTKVN